MGQRGEMGQPKKGTSGIFHGFARAEQNGAVNVTVRTAGAEGSGVSWNLTFKFLSHYWFEAISLIYKYQGLSEDRKVSGS